MTYLLDAIYLFLLIALSPWLIYKALTTGKYRRGLADKLLGRAPQGDDSRPCVWFHGVSVGEIHLLRQVVAGFRRRHPDWQCVISTTTDTGFEEAGKHFPDLKVFYWPLDFSWAVRRALTAVHPRLVVLAEGELWPNFLAAARQLGVRVAIVNGRMSPRSFRRYQWFGKSARALVDQVDLLAVQTEEYAEHFKGLGAAKQKVQITGSVKYDGVCGNRNAPRTLELGRLLDISPGDLVWVAGSTQAPEEALVLSIFRRLKAQFPSLRLLIVPRQRERFDEVAAQLERAQQPFVRRSLLTDGIPNPNQVILIDTIGELGALWGLAEVAFVGGSLDGKRGGQNMIEPAAYGAAVVFGPHVWNFRDSAARLVAAQAALQVSDAAELGEKIECLLRKQHERRRLGAAARTFVLSQQGATDRTLDLLDQLVIAPVTDKAA
jgi:3-deoxy-D-manno-octulosonic-acid transferase